MPSVTIERLWPLALLAIVIGLWLIKRRTLTNFHPRQVLLLTIVRSLVMALLVAALMQPVMHPSGHWLSVIYGLDLSESVSTDARGAAMEWIREANRRGDPNHSAIMLFGADAAWLSDGTPLEDLARDVDRSATNLERAFDTALEGFAPNHAKRLVLITDGRDNAGRTADGLARIRQDGVRVYTVPASPRSVGDTWIDSLAVPERATAEEPFAVDVEVFSQSGGRGVLELRDVTGVLATETVDLTPGYTRVALDVTLTDPGAVTVEALLQISGDPIEANNHFTQSVLVTERPRVLYIEGRPASAHYLQGALQRAGLLVDHRGPRGLPATAGDLEPFSAVVLSDVPRDQLSQRQMLAVETYVTDLGGGFILVGGESVYGEEGYTDTPIERILPVTFTTKEKPREVALVIVLDKSWSMAGTKIELSKEASKAAVDVLQDDHSIGVVSFNNDLDWPVPLQLAANRDWIKQRISTIVPSGYTNIYPALEAAYQELAATQAYVRHVILLSDGRTYPAEYERLVTEMAEQKMTVSTVAVGAEADQKLLGDIAAWGEGRAYVVADAAEVPQIFAEETERAARPTLVEEPVRPIVRKQVELFTGLDWQSSPALHGYTSTKAKDTAEMLLDTEIGDPILARWQYGLGRTAVFTSDAKDRWAADWLSWPGYGKFWAQLVREVMHHDDVEMQGLHVRREDSRARIEIRAVRDDGTFGNMLLPQVEIVGPDATTAVIEAHQTGPGTYEASVPVEDDGEYVIRTLDPDIPGLARMLPPPYPAEYRLLPPRLDLLQAMADGTGGVFDPTIDALFADTGDTTVLPRPLWPYLAALALILYLVDLALRRVRLFDEADFFEA